MKNLLKDIKLFTAAGGCALCLGMLAVPAHAAPVITVVDADLTAAPYTFSYLGSSFTFGSTGNIFGPLSVSTTGSAAISSFGGFLGFPVTPSPFFTDRGTVSFGPDVFGSFAPFPSTTPVNSSNGENFLGLRVTANGQNYFGFAFTTNAFVNTIGFETLPETTITATTAVPESTTWAMLILGFGMIGGAMRYRRRVTKAALA